MNVTVNRMILSFKDMPRLAEQCEKTVLLLRHSMRETLNNGIDPGLTAEGADYARQCGTFLAGMKEVSFGASPRKRTFETAQGLQNGGGFPVSEIETYPEISELGLFSHPENLAAMLKDGSLAEVLRSYFTTGKAPGTVDLEEYARGLSDFLTQSRFKSRNTILLSHDIVCVSLLLPRRVYPFKLDDWCGYIQGGALLCSKGQWQLHYIVPDAADRKQHALFV